MWAVPFVSLWPKLETASRRCCQSPGKKQALPVSPVVCPLLRISSGRLERQEPLSHRVLVGFKLTHFIYCHAICLQGEGAEVSRTCRAPVP